MDKFMTKKISFSINTNIDISNNSPLPSSSQTPILGNQIKMNDRTTVKSHKYL